MQTRHMKDAVYAQFARIGKAVSAPKRIELLALLGEGPSTVESLANAVAISVANASQHLQTLRRARLVEAHKSGLFVEYRIADARVLEFIGSMRALAEARLSEVEEIMREYLKGGGSLEGVSGKELLRRAREGQVTVLDVRSFREYRAGHMPGARSVPMAELSRRIAELPRDRDVVAYCGGANCVMAAEAVRILRSKGYRAHRMKESFEDWRARGQRQERSGSSARR